MSILYIGKEIKNIAINKAAEFLQTDAAQISSHPDYLYVGLDDKAKSIGVDKAVLIVDKAALRPCIAPHTVCVIDNMDKMTVEAQNKLLKTLEESKMIIIGICYEDTLLATVKSRCHIIRVSDNSLPDDVRGIFNDVSEALNSDDRSRILRVLNLVKEKDPESFFQTHRQYVGELIAHIGNCSSKKLSEKDCLMFADHRARSLGSGYSKDDFFLLVATCI